MIILIGGAGCTGKTVMAQRLMELYKVPYLSMDHVKMGLILGVPDCPFQAEDPEEAITRYLWPVVRAILTTNLENGQHLIIEGCYLPHDAVETLPAPYRRQVLALEIGFTPDYIRRCYETIVGRRGAIEVRAYGETRTAEEMIRENERRRTLCQRHELPFFAVDKHYEKDLARAYRWIEDEINRRGLYLPRGRGQCAPVQPPVFSEGGHAART